MGNTAARKGKQVPEGYLIVGIDSHKKGHAAVAITQDFTTRDKFKFDNTRGDLEILLRRAKTEMVKSGCRGVIFAIETGGHYWRNAAYFLDEQGIPFRFINQFTLKQRREGKDLNRRKNDYRASLNHKLGGGNIVSGGQGDTTRHFENSFEQTRVHNMVPLPSRLNPYEV